MNDDYTRNATVISIHDADTITVRVDLGYRLGFETPLRFYRINAPELSTPAGKKSRDWLKQKLPIGAQIQIKTFKDPTDKYGRYLAEVIYEGVNLNDLLVKSGLAKYWDGTGEKPV